MTLRRLLILVGLLLIFCQDSAQSQDMLQAQPLAAGDSRIVTARQLMKNQNWEAAAAMLEVVYESDESNQTVINLLKNCYSQLKQYGKLETLIRRQIDLSPTNLTLRLELGEVLADQGMKEKAVEAYRDAAGFIKQPDNGQYLLFVRS